jgi:hypothetical protein
MFFHYSYQLFVLNFASTDIIQRIVLKANDLRLEFYPFNPFL